MMPLSDYQEFLKEGDQYFQAALGGSRLGNKFSPEVLFHMAAMGMEKHLMALLMAKGTMPDNHSFYDFIAALERLDLLTPDMKSRMLWMEAKHPLCALVLTEKKPFSSADIPVFMETALIIQNFVYEKIPAARPRRKLRLKEKQPAASAV